MRDIQKAFAVAGAALLVLGAGTGCTAKYRRELDDRNRELRSVKEERDELRAQVDDLKTKERLYQEQLAAVRNTAKAREAGAPPEILEPIADRRAKAIAGKLENSGVDTSVRAGRVVLTLPAAITFASGKASLTGKGREVLRRVSEALKTEYAAGKIWVEGHTDDEPIKKSGWKSNRHLSIERGLAVAEFLKAECGVPDRRLVLAGHGEWDPVAENKSSAGREKNRRVELVLED